MQINSKVFALGNSNAIRLPRIVMEALALKTDDPVTLEVVGPCELLIRKPTLPHRPSIRDLMAGWQGDRPAETESSGTVGKEQL